MNTFYRNLALWLVIGVVMVMIFKMFTPPTTTTQEIVFSDFLEMVEKGKVSEVSVRENDVTGVYQDGRTFKVYVPNDPNFLTILRENKVRISAHPPEESPWYIGMLASWLPILLFFGVWFYLMRQMQGGGGKALSFGKSRAKLTPADAKHKVTFADVAGINEAKEELEEIIDFLKDPPKFQKLGGKLPKGVMLIGPPGTGKTLLARAIAGEAEVPFFNISGSDFVEMFVGVGASRVRDLFDQGKKNAPCIIFIDEIDAVGRHRGAGMGGGHDEREQTLNQMLVELDGFESNEGVIIIAATNRPDVLDPALLRPGRFDRQVVVSIPDIKGRKGILDVHATKVPLNEDVDLKVVARGTPGFSGADLANLVNEAALLAARNDQDKVKMDDFEMAKDKVLMGVERRSMVISEEEKRNTAYHEAGHALVAKSVPNADPLHKVTIIPRGRALGVTMQLPVDEKHTYPKDFLFNNIAILMGGRAAEEMALDDIRTGAGNDIERATDLAHKMVCEWGMSKELGPMTFGRNDHQIFLGRDFGNIREYSEKTAIMIDIEIRRILNEAHQKAKDILKSRLDHLHALAKALLEKEVLGADEIDEILNSCSAAP